MALLPSVDDLELAPGESVVAEWVVDHLQNGIPLRGKLLLTSQRAAFQPTKMGLLVNALEVLGATLLNRGVPWSSTLSEISSVRDDGPCEKQGASGRDIALIGRDGSAQSFFVVTDHEAVASTLSSALRA